MERISVAGVVVEFEGVAGAIAAHVVSALNSVWIGRATLWPCWSLICS